MSKLITVSENLLQDILPLLKGTPLEKKVTDLIENTGKYQTQNITYFPKKACGVYKCLYEKNKQA